MKVVILCTQLEGGGAQRASFKLSGELNKRGIYTENWFLYKKRDIYKDLGTVRICQQRPIRTPLDYLLICIKYFKLIKTEKPDVIISFTHYANVLGLAIAYYAGVKVRIASHRNPSWGDMSKWLIKLDNYCAKKGIYSAITAVSISTKKTFAYYPPSIYEQIVVINNGFDFSFCHKTKEEARDFFHLPKAVKLIGTIGRLSKQKNQQLLIKAVSKLEDVYLAIVGAGELQNELNSLIQELGMEGKVFMLGEISHDLIPEFLRTLDVYVMPSIFEGLSNALVEAMSMSLPVLSSNAESQKDVIISENGIINGILLPIDDVEIWRKQIDELLKNKRELAWYAERSAIRAQDFSIEKMADGFWEVIKKHANEIA